MKQRIFKGKKFSIYNYSTKIKNQPVSRDILEKPNIAAIVAVKNNQILVVKCQRFPNGVDIEIPAGEIEKGEKPIEAALREFREETGHVAKKMIPFLKFYISIGYSTQTVNCFIAEEFELAGKPKLDPDEFLTVKKLDFNKLLKMILSGKIIDSITISAVLTYALKKKPVN
jgi:ADP-ribose pyrophosphatase